MNNFSLVFFEQIISKNLIDLKRILPSTHLCIRYTFLWVFCDGKKSFVDKDLLCAVFKIKPETLRKDLRELARYEAVKKHMQNNWGKEKNNRAFLYIEPLIELGHLEELNKVQGIINQLIDEYRKKKLT